MKNILKFTSLILLTLVFGCNSDDDNARFSNDPASGWIEFQSAASNRSISFLESNTLEVVVNMKVPYNKTDLNIAYDLVSVSGADVSTLYNKSNLLVPANNGGVALVNGFPKISFDLEALANITEPLVFDIVLKSTDRSSVTIGINGADRQTTHRVSICPSFDSEIGTFLGEYSVSVPTGDGPFGVQFADGAIVTLTAGPDGPLSRSFSIDYLPGIAAGDPLTFVDFTFDEATGVVVADQIGTGVGCGSTYGGIVYGNDSGNEAALPCGDDTITLNILDFKFIGDPEDEDDDNGTGGCDQEDIATTIVLTKV